MLVSRDSMIAARPIEAKALNAMLDVTSTDFDQSGKNEKRMNLDQKSLALPRTRVRLRRGLGQKNRGSIVYDQRPRYSLGFDLTTRCETARHGLGAAHGSDRSALR